MRAGFIYFASTSTHYIKVGRYMEHITPAKKEASYRRLDPGFTIRFAYWCEDVVAEEKRVLSMLRLVAGTAVSSAGRECFAMSIEDAVHAAAADSDSVQKNYARKLIMAHPVNGSTVGRLIENASLSLQGRLVGPEASDAFYVATMALDKLGIFLAAGGASLGLSVGAYASVIDEQPLRKHVPGLAKVGVSLNKLALY